MDDATGAEGIGRELIDAFCGGDMARMRALLSDDLRAYITNRDGGVDEVGADEYVRRVEAMDLASADFQIAITQVVNPRPNMVLMMVEVRAGRHGRALHNHATHCLFTDDGRVTEWWMVEALPEESDAFWAS